MTKSPVAAKAKPPKQPPAKPKAVAATNLALRQIASEFGLSHAELAELLFVSKSTIFSWYRKRYTRVPAMAVSLLCYKLGLPQHPCLKNFEPPPKRRQL